MGTSTAKNLETFAGTIIESMGKWSAIYKVRKYQLKYLNPLSFNIAAAMKTLAIAHLALSDPKDAELMINRLTRVSSSYFLTL